MVFYYGIFAAENSKKEQLKFTINIDNKNKILFNLGNLKFFFSFRQFGKKNISFCPFFSLNNVHIGIYFV